MTKKILHVCLMDKFIPPYIDFVEEHFGLDDHFFWLSGDHYRYPVKQKQSIYKDQKNIFFQIKGLIKLTYLLNTSEKIILHGLFNTKVTLLLFLMPWLLKKSYWCIWGGDLYVYLLGDKNWWWGVKEFIRRPVIKKMGFLVTYVSGDVQLAREWYGAVGKYQECIGYMNNICSGFSDSSKKRKETIILLGNSADPSNDHIFMFEKLLPFKNLDIMIYAPLSYGDKSYASEIINIGFELFGSKFKPIINFMPYNQYVDFLLSVDIAIFNHNRQQAMGNIIMLLGLGKTVYIRSNTAHSKFFKDMGLIFGDTEFFSSMDFLDTYENREKLIKYFSNKNLLQQWSDLFNG